MRDHLQFTDTVGAGDAFHAAMLAWSPGLSLLSLDGLRGVSTRPLKVRLEFVAGAAAITCTRRGADMPRRGELP